MPLTPPEDTNEALRPVELIRDSEPMGSYPLPDVDDLNPRTLDGLVRVWNARGAALPVAVVASIFDDVLEDSQWGDGSSGSLPPSGGEDIYIDYTGFAHCGQRDPSLLGLVSILERALGDGTGEFAVPPLARVLLERLTSEEPSDRPRDAEELRSWLRDALGSPASRDEVLACVDAATRDLLPLAETDDDDSEANDDDSEAETLIPAHRSAAAAPVAPSLSADAAVSQPPSEPVALDSQTVRSDAPKPQEPGPASAKRSRKSKKKGPSEWTELLYYAPLVQASSTSVAMTPPSLGTASPEDAMPDASGDRPPQDEPREDAEADGLSLGSSEDPDSAADGLAEDGSVPSAVVEGSPSTHPSPSSDRQFADAVVESLTPSDQLEDSNKNDAARDAPKVVSQGPFVDEVAGGLSSGGSFEDSVADAWFQGGAPSGVDVPASEDSAQEPPPEIGEPDSPAAFPDSGAPEGGLPVGALAQDAGVDDSGIEFVSATSGMDFAGHGGEFLPMPEPVSSVVEHADAANEADDPDAYGAGLAELPPERAPEPGSFVSYPSFSPPVVRHSFPRPERPVAVQAAPAARRSARVTTTGADSLIMPHERHFWSVWGLIAVAALVATFLFFY